MTQTDVAELKALMQQATPGPWQIVEDRHPHYLGGQHVERRIFTTWDHPQLGEPLSVVNGSVGIPAEKDGEAIHMVTIEEPDARLIVALRNHAPTLIAAAEHLIKSGGLDPDDNQITV